MTTSVYLRFYEELNDFLPEVNRKRRFEHTFEGELTVRDLLEMLDVPPSQVELVLADDASVDFTHTLQQGEWISFYPVFESLDIRPALRVRADPLRKTCFITGAGLRPLARHLRLCGFDTLDRSDRSLDEAIRLSEAEGRILLMQRGQPPPAGSVSRFLCLQEVKPRQQLLEIIGALDLVASAHPLTRCPLCNQSLFKDERGDFSEVLLSDIPLLCGGCGRRLSAGPHLRRVRCFLRHVLGAKGTKPS